MVLAWFIITMFGLIAAALVLREAWKDFQVARVAHISPVAENDTKGDLIQESMFALLMLGALVLSGFAASTIEALRPYILPMILVGHAINVGGGGGKEEVALTPQPLPFKEGDSVAAITVFREGLAAGRGMTDNDDPGGAGAPEGTGHPS